MQSFQTLTEWNWWLFLLQFPLSFRKTLYLKKKEKKKLHSWVLLAYTTQNKRNSLCVCFWKVVEGLDGDSGIRRVETWPKWEEVCCYSGWGDREVRQIGKSWWYVSDLKRIILVWKGLKTRDKVADFLEKTVCILS